MSKNLVKILSICAFVIILPLAILATALCVTESASYKLKLYVAGVDATNTSASCKVLINGEERKDNQMTFGKNKEVTVTFEGVGYDFEAWYNGTDTTITAENKASDKISYTFKMTSNTSLTAKCNVKSYRVSYTGKDIENKVVEYKYGDALAVIENNPDFGGWILKGTSNIYRTATFPTSGDVIVEVNWVNNKIVSYYDGEEVIFNKIYTEEEFNALELISADSELVKARIAKGYAFAGWKDSNGEAFNLADMKGDKYVSSPKAVNIYLSQKAIDYKLNIKAMNGTEDVQEVVYNIETGFSEFVTPVRTGYKFKGIKFNGKVYEFKEIDVEVNEPEAQDGTTEETPTEPEVPTKKVFEFVCGEERLSDVLLNGSTTSFDISCVWVPVANPDEPENPIELPSIEVKYNASDINMKKNAYGLVNGEYKLIKTVDGITLDFNDDGGFNLNDLVFATFIARYNYEGFYFRTGGDINQGYTYEEAILKEIRVFHNETLVSVRPDSGDSFTYAKLIGDFGEKNINIKDAIVNITFIFELKTAE